MTLIGDEQIRKLSGLKILGLNPPVFDFAWFDLWSKPVGLLNLLGFLRGRGNEVRLLDCLYEARQKPAAYGRWKVRRQELAKPAVYRQIPRRYYRFGLGPEELRERLLARTRPDLVLVTSIMTYWYPAVFETIRVAREVFPGLPIVLGGLYAALCPGHARNSGADRLMLSAPARGGAALPLNLYDGPEYALLSTSHGCPRHCQYCASAVLTPRFQPRPLAEITADLDGQMAAGDIADLAFYDDALLWDRENRFYPLCRYIRRKYPNLRLHSPNGLSVAMLDEECGRILYESGFRTLRLSLEGIDDYTNAAGFGKSGPEKYARAVAALLKAGFAPEDLETYILAGLPGQDLNAVRSSLEFVKSVGGRPKLCEFSPIPGTRLYEEAVRDNPEVGQEPLWHNNTVYSSYLSGRIPPQKLQDLKTLCREPAKPARPLTWPPTWP